MNFLKVVGFNFDSNPEEVQLSSYNKLLIEGSIEAINAHIVSLGASMDGG